MVVVLALGSALAYALASVAQHAAATSAPESYELRPGLLVHLAQRRLWLGGIAADIAGFLLQAAALERGELVLVQPLLVSGILMALPLGAARLGRRMTTSEWGQAAALAFALATFLVVAAPEEGRDTASGRAWVMTGLLVGVATVVLVGVGQVRVRHRASLYGCAAAVVYAWTAALLKTTTGTLGGGVVSMLLSWPVYALAVAGLAGMLLAQSAFQAGPLRASLPALTVIDPVVSACFGVVLFGERVHTGSLAGPVEAAAAVVMCVAAVGLSRSPLVGAGTHSAPSEVRER